MIDDELTRAFDRIADQLNGVYFCRFDMKCRSIAELKEGKQIRMVYKYLFNRIYLIQDFNIFLESSIILNISLIGWFRKVPC